MITGMAMKNMATVTNMMVNITKGMKKGTAASPARMLLWLNLRLPTLLPPRNLPAIITKKNTPKKVTIMLTAMSTRMKVVMPEGPAVFSGVYYRLASFGNLEINIEYYIDTLTLVMFTMVTFIATCIHIFAMGYMSDELTDEYVDHQAHYSNGKHVHRPGRFYKFFAFLSLFCFSMLGLVIAGNIFQVFVFWELVGVCSYFLIGFYVERKSASTAANKAFIMNRVGGLRFSHRFDGNLDNLWYFQICRT